MANDALGDICIASRTASKCEAIIDSIKRKDHIADSSRSRRARRSLVASLAMERR